MGKPDPLRLHQFSARVKDPASAKSTLGQGHQGGIGGSYSNDNEIARARAEGRFLGKTGRGGKVFPSRASRLSRRPLRSGKPERGAQGWGFQQSDERVRVRKQNREGSLTS